MVVKIISGSLKGRTIKGFDIDGTRPTMDRVKESLFGTIQGYIPDSTVLDLFSGSGNLGFEAISNNAKYCYFKKKKKKCTTLIEKYIKDFDISNSCKVLNMHYNKALNYFIEQNIKFDIIFLDPPYEKNIAVDSVSLILKYKLLNNDGIIIIETDQKEREIKELEEINVEIYDTRKYGRANLIFLVERG